MACASVNVYTSNLYHQHKNIQLEPRPHQPGRRTCYCPENVGDLEERGAAVHQFGSAWRCNK